MVHFVRLERASAFRKLAASMWQPPNDPHIFGFTDVDMSRALDFMHGYNTRNACKVTITHLVVRAVALVLARHPELNAKVGFAHIFRRDSVDVFCQVASDDGRDLSGVKIEGTDRLALKQIAERLTRSARDIREDKDPQFRQSRSLLGALPLWGVRLVLRLMDLLVNKLNLHLPKLGMPGDPFGSAMVTSVGMFGVDSGFAPFTPLARCPMIITVTRVKPRPWVVDDAVAVRPVLRLCGTFDHRIIDGYHAGKLSTEIEQLFTSPDQLLTEQELLGEKPNAAGVP